MVPLEQQELICGVDEVGRGCLFGRVYTAAVIWDDTITHPLLKDSKKLSSKQRGIMRYFIEENAIDYSVSYEENTIIDQKNILHATIGCMHKSIRALNVEPDLLKIDGNYFKPYPGIRHECEIKGDARFKCISAASIIAKVYHDEWIRGLVSCGVEPELDRYDLLNNMGYGTRKHISAIKEYGPTKYHRMTFAPMSRSPLSPLGSVL